MPKKKHYCYISGKEIPKERVEALKMLKIPEERWTCVEHSIDKPRQGLYLGENGTSELLIVDKVYNDSVRSVFKGSGKTSMEPEEDEETGREDYNEKELSYYNNSDEQVDPEEKIEIIKRHQT